MDPRVLAITSTSGGIITREQALDLGMSPSQIKFLVRRRDWVIVRRGVYADAEVWAAADDYRGKPRIRTRAALVRMRRAWVLSHDSAAHELGLEILAPDDPFVHVTRPGFTGAWTEYGVKHHLARYRPRQVVEAHGFQVLDLARTAVDIARERDEDHGLAACDSALRMGVSRADLWAAVEDMVSWPNVTRVRTCIELADGGAQGVIESLGRRLVLELGVGNPETQFPVVTERGVAWCDLRVGNHIFEIDGRVKYRAVEAGGFAEGGAEAAVWDEKLRQRLICAEGLGMSRIVWADFWGDNRVAARARLLAEYAVTANRFGSTLAPRLARNAEQLRRDQGA